LKVEYINPFIVSVQEMFSTMLGIEVSHGKIGVVTTEAQVHAVTALIGLSGSAKGTVALCLPTNTAVSIVNRLLGTDSTAMDDTVTDGIAEVVNIMAGSAKAALSVSANSVIELSLPTVVRGGDYTVKGPSNAMWLEVPFKSELGEFSLRVTFEMDTDTKET
jgi:chemotaxis protein CheX